METRTCGRPAGSAVSTMKNRLASLFAIAFVAIALLGAVGALPASAAVGPGDDRQLKTPTGWWTYNGVTLAQIGSLVSANGARLTDIQAESPTKFTVTMVSNSGAYASGWWYYVGQTVAQVNAQLSAHNARPISINAYSTSSGVRFAVVMVSNTGANAKASWWYYGTPSFIASKITANNARLINLSPHPTAGWYVGILVNNTGSNATGWWYYYNASESFDQRPPVGEPRPAH